MKSLKIIFSLALILCLLPFPSLAESGASSEKWAKGTVRLAETIEIYAPVGGQIAPFDWEIGDEFAMGAPLLALEPVEVLAPYSGVIRIQHAQVGDNAQSVVHSYGGLCYLERLDVQWLRTTTKTAYNDAENRDIRVGETLRVYNGKTSNRDKKEAEGRIVSVSGNEFVVEFPSGIFDPEENVRVYRGVGTDYKEVDMVGRGDVTRVPAIPIAAEGVIAEILIQEGQTVERGEPLYAVDSAGARHETAPARQITAPAGGVVRSIYVQGGQWVAKGQLMMVISPSEPLECVVEVDELDILSLLIGQVVRLKSDANPGETLSATVERIAPIGMVMLDTTKYDVTLRVAGDTSMLRPTMHVTAYWD